MKITIEFDPSNDLDVKNLKSLCASFATVTPTATAVTPTAATVTPTATAVTPTATAVAPAATVTPTATAVTPTFADLQECAKRLTSQQREEVRALIKSLNAENLSSLDASHYKAVYEVMDKFIKQ